MTPDELSKEAERILGIVRNPDTINATHIEMAVERLRAVHDAGFNEAREKAADALRLTYPDGFDAMDGYKAIRALRPESGGGE